MSDSLAAIYASIPAVKGCRTACSDCCGPVPVTDGEARRMPAIMPPVSMPPVPFKVTPTRACGTCAYSTSAGCSVYEDRPFMCRLFATVPTHSRLACPHGAKPDKPLTPAQAARLHERYHRLAESPQ